MSTLKAAIIGLGVGEQHIEGYRAHPGCEVVAVCDIDQAVLDRVQREHPDLRAVTDANEILDDPDIAVVSIASHDDHHHEQIARALEGGKHVFVEKPLCLYDHEAADIRARLEARPDLLLSSNLILRRSPRFELVRDRIAAGEMGRLYHVEADYDYGRLAKLTDGWRGRLDFYSVVYGGGVHVVDLLLWLTGDHVTEVAAYGNRICTEGTQFRYEDMVVAILRFSSGLVGKITANFGCVMPHFHAVSVFGTQATFINGPQEGTWFSRTGDEIVAEAVTAAYPGVHKGDLIYGFVDAIVRGGQPEVTADDVFAAMSVCFAIEKAARQGGPVAVEYL